MVPDTSDVFSGADGDAFGDADSVISPPDIDPSQEPLRPRYAPEGLGFFDTPWPSDLRLTADGHVDLVGFPSSDNETVGNYVSTASAQIIGFSTNPVIYVNFDRLPSERSVPSVAESITPLSPIQLLAIDGSCATSIPIEIKLDHEGDQFVPENTLMVSPVPGVVLEPNGRYAVVIYDWFGREDGLSTERPSAFDEASENDVFDPLWSCLDEAGQPADRIAIATAFTTQDIWGELDAIQAMIGEMDVPTVDEMSTELEGNWLVTSGTYQTPGFQRGEPPYATEGGAIEFDDGGQPIVQRWESVGFMIARPPDAVNPPVLLWIGGTGTTLRGVMPSEVGKHLFKLGFAIASFEPPFHGSRGTGEEVATLAFNVFNPEAARSNFRQQAADTTYFARLLQESLGVDDLELNTDTMLYGGHSQGALVGAILAGVESAFSAYVLNGVGGYLSTTIVERTDPLDINQTVRSLIGESRPLDRFHPIVSIAQMLADVTDPVNYAGRWRGWPEAPSGSNVFLTNGLLDQAVPAGTIEALMRAGNVPPIEPQGWDYAIPGLPRLEAEPIPVHGNVAASDEGLLTLAGFLDAQQGHATLYRNLYPLLLAAQFWTTALEGVPVLAVACRAANGHELEPWPGEPNAWSAFGRLPGVREEATGNFNGGDGCPRSSGAGEMFFQFVPPTSGNYVAYLRSGLEELSSFTLTRHEGCFNALDELQCVSGRNTLNLELEALRPVLLRVDGQNAFANGKDFELVVVRAIQAAGETCAFELDRCEPELVCQAGACSPVCAGRSLNDLPLGEGRFGEVASLPNTWGHRDSFFDPPVECDVTADAPEVVYDFTAPSAGTYLFTTDFEETVATTVLYAMDECADSAEVLACAKGGPRVDHGAELRVELDVGQSIALVVDGDYPNLESAAFRLEIMGVNVADEGAYCDATTEVCADDKLCFQSSCIETCGGLSINDYSIGHNRFQVRASAPTNQEMPIELPLSPIGCPAEGYSVPSLVEMSFTAPQTGSYRFGLEDSLNDDYSTWLMLREACDSPDTIACRAIRRGGEMELDLEAEQTIIVGVAERSEWAAGRPFVLNVGLFQDAETGGFCDGVVAGCEAEFDVCLDESCRPGCNSLDLADFEVGESVYRDNRILAPNSRRMMRLCGTHSGQGLTYSFQAPETGFYRFIASNAAIFMTDVCGDEAEIVACGSATNRFIDVLEAELDEGSGVVLGVQQNTTRGTDFELVGGLIREAGLDEACDRITRLCGAGLLCDQGSCQPACASRVLNNFETEPGVFEDSGTIEDPLGLQGGNLSVADYCRGFGDSQLAQEVTYQFTAPQDGLFEFSTDRPGTDGGLNLYLVSGCQDSPELLACAYRNGLHHEQYAGTILHEMVADETITVVVDGFREVSSATHFTLRARLISESGRNEPCDTDSPYCAEGLVCVDGLCQPECETFDLNRMPVAEGRWGHQSVLPVQAAAATTTSCRLDDNARLGYRFRAPAAGEYSFSVATEGSVLFSLHENCDSDPIDSMCLFSRPELGGRILERTLERDEEVLLSVKPSSSSFGQPYDLLVAASAEAELGESCSSVVAPCADGLSCLDGLCRSPCPAFNLLDNPHPTFPDSWLASGTFANASQYGRSCVEGARTDSVLYSFTAPRAGSYVFSAPRQPDHFTPLMSILDRCDGEVIVCASPGGDGGVAVIELAESESVVVQLDPDETEQYSLFVTRASESSEAPCDRAINLCPDGQLCTNGVCSGGLRPPVLERLEGWATRDPNIYHLEIEGRDVDRATSLLWRSTDNIHTLNPLEYDRNWRFTTTEFFQSFEADLENIGASLINVHGRPGDHTWGVVHPLGQAGDRCPAGDSSTCAQPLVCLEADTVFTCQTLEAGPVVIDTAVVDSRELDGSNPECAGALNRNLLGLTVRGQSDAPPALLHLSGEFWRDVSHIRGIDGGEFQVSLSRCLANLPLPDTVEVRIEDATGTVSAPFELELPAI